MNVTTLRRTSLGVSALAIIGMGTLTVACTPRTQQPTQPDETSLTGPTALPTEKDLRTNVTRTGMSAAPPIHPGGNVPCGFGPAGGAGCHTHRSGGDGGYGGGSDGGGGGGD